MKREIMRLLIASCITLVLLASSGCGSTGAGAGSAATTGQAQGVYSGTTSTGETFETIVLPNDTYYALYGRTVGNVFTVSGLITGQGTSDAGQYTASVNDYYYTGVRYSGSVKATYAAGSSISGTVTETGNPGPVFSGTTLPISSFPYTTPASISDITGTWNGNLFGNTPAAVSISANGSVTGSSDGCTFSGTVTPDSSNKNFFDFTLTYGGSPCLLPYQTQSGIAVDYLLSDGITHQLLAAVSSGSYGNVFIANRITAPPVSSPKLNQISSFTSQSTVYNPASTYTATFSSPVTRGDLIAVAFWWNYAPGSSIVSVTDSAGNIYRPILQTPSAYSNDWSAWIYAATNVTGASNVAVTVKVSYANADQFSMAILDYSNLKTLDATSTSGGTTGMPMTSGTAITHQPNELILGVGVADVNLMAGSGFNSRFTSGNFSVEDKIVSSTGSYNATFNAPTSIANEGWDIGMATFY
jgi:hypothetical protein